MRAAFAPFGQARFRTIPAVPLALWFAAGSTAGLWLAGSWHGVWPPLFAGGVSLALSLASAPEVTRRGAACLLLGAAMAWLHPSRWAEGYAQYLPRENAGASVRATVLEPVGDPATVAPLPTPRRYTARVTAIRTGPQARWRECSGKTVLESRDPPTLRYGDLIEAEGAFVHPPGERFPGGFDYRHYAASRGISHLYRVAELRPRGRAGGWYAAGRAAYRLRDRFVRLETDGLAPENAELLAAFTAGYRHGLSAQTRDTFLRSGAIHVFAISGLHTGIVAALLTVLLLCVRTPYVLRYALLPVLLGGYVFVTGGAPSASRAWLMISVYCLSRAAFRPVQPLQAVALAALGLLVWQPLNLMRSGFQFSFVIVSFLVIGWQRAVPYYRSLIEKEYWRPAPLRSPQWRSHLALRSSQMLCAGCLAWLGSAGLVLTANSLFIPAAVPVNMGISLLLLPAFVAGFAKALFAAIGLGWAETVLAAFLDGVIVVIRGVAELGGRPPASLAVAGGGAATGFAYYALAVPLMLPRLNARIRALFGAGVALLLGSALAAPLGSAPTAAVCHGGGGRSPAVVLFYPTPTEPVVVNTGGYTWSRDLRTYLRSRGCSRLDTLVVARGRQDCARGLLEWITAYKPRSLWLPESRTSPKNRALLQAAAAQQIRQGGRVRWFSTDTHLDSAAPVSVAFSREAEVHESTVVVRGPKTTVRLTLAPRRSGVVSLRLESTGAPVRDGDIPRSNQPRITLW